MVQGHKNVIQPLCVFLITVFVLGACVNHDIDAPVIVSCADETAISFEINVRPIINSNCAISGCHNGDLDNNLNWTILKNFQDHAGEIKRRITLPLSDSDKMPRVGKLTYDQIKVISCWVEQGAKDN